MPPDGCSDWVEQQVSKCAKMIVAHDFDAERELQKLKPKHRRWAFVEALHIGGDNPDNMHFMLAMDEAEARRLRSYCSYNGFHRCFEVLFG